MSEFDSLSDSDWLDIASRASDDNDSVSSHDDFSSRPLSRLSRRSSISFGSSHESEVEAWEGFVDESGDESAVEPGMCIVRPLAPHPTESIPIGHIPDISHDSSDDRLVKEALDQSLVGTLSASRTSSASHSAHSSIRDLRLSFPDPLTSSRDQLGKPYPEVFESDSPTNDADTTISLTDSMVSSSEQKPEPVAAIPQVLHHEATQQDNALTNMGLDIILYGASSSIKWSFVQDFIQKAANFSGNVVLSTLDPDAGPIQTLDLRCGKDNSILTTITVQDCTNVNSITHDTFEIQDDVIRASLAIVYLPATTLPVLSLHTAYLPVLVPGSPEDDKSSTLHHAADDDWELLGVPANRVVDLTTDKTPVLSADVLSRIESWKVFEVIRNILDNPVQQIRTAAADNGHPVHAVTFFALVSIIMGFAFNTAFRTPMPVPTGTVENSSDNTWGILSANQINRSLVAPVAGTSTALATSSLKDFALSVLTPGITSLSVNPSGVSSLSLTSRVNSLSISDHHPSSLSLIHTPCTSLAVPGPSRQPAVVSDVPQALSSKDVLIKPVTPASLSEIRPEPSMVMASRTQKRSHPDFAPPSSVSVRFTNSLSEVMDTGTKIFSNAVRLEKDLVDVMDDLMNAIHTQTQTVVSQSKGKARALGEEVLSRNDKARGRARELKKKGEELLNSATTQFFERTEIARQRAKGLKGSIWQTPAWKSYERVHAEWVSRLKDARQCARDKPSWRDVRDAWGTHGLAGAHRVSCPPLTAR